MTIKWSSSDHQGAIKKQSRGNHLSSEGDEMTLPIRIGAIATTRRLERLGQDGDLDCSLLQRRAHLMGGGNQGPSVAISMQLRGRTVGSCSAAPTDAASKMASELMR